jgi:hypothetical protein
MVDYAPAWLTVLPTIANFISASFFLAWLIVVIHCRGWINLTGIWLQSGENAISNGKSASSYDSPATPIMRTHLIPDQGDR